MKNHWLMIALLLVATFVRGSAGAESHRPSSSEQVEFSAEYVGVKKPVPIPKDVLAILSKDDLVVNVSRNEGIPLGKLPTSWFSASEIHLSKSDEKDLIVEADGRLAGGNVVTFWVFVTTAHAHKLVMTAPAHNLFVKKAYWNGYRTIELMSATAEKLSTVLCRYNGMQYVPYLKKSERIP